MSSIHNFPRVLINIHNFAQVFIGFGPDGDAMTDISAVVKIYRKMCVW